MINKNAYRLDLPRTVQNHNVFHVAYLDCFTQPVRGLQCSEPHLVIVEKTGEWEVYGILDSRWHYQKLQYLVWWAGYNHICASWQPAEDREYARDLVDELHQKHPDWPWEYMYTVRGWRYGEHRGILDIAFVPWFLHSHLFRFNSSSALYKCISKM